MNKKVYSREYNPPPLVSCGNITEEEKRSPLYKHISRLVTPIFENSLKETSKNHMVVGSGRSGEYKSVFVQPHNYRSYFKYSRVSSVLSVLSDESGIYKPEGRVPEGGVGSVYYKRINNGKELSFPDFGGCRVVVKKNLIEVVNKINHKHWFPVKMNVDTIERDIREIVRLKDEQTLDVLRLFVSCFGGSSDFVLVNSISEVKVSGEDKIDLIPERMKFHNPVAKKVYNERNVEFKSEASASQYLINRVGEDFLEEKFDSLRKEIMKGVPLVSPLESVKLSVVCFPRDVFACADSIVGLSDSDKASLTEWFFSEFGGVV